LGKLLEDVMDLDLPTSAEAIWAKLPKQPPPSGHDTHPRSRLSDEGSRQGARRVSLTALAYNLRRALNILGVDAMTAAVRA
jgi:hypothetical protein